jgi:DNA-binding phage protein
MSKAVTVPFSDIVQARVHDEPAYAAALLEEAMRCFSRGETAVARGHVRDVIKGSIGYTELSRRTGTPETSLVRMFGPSGNPTFGNVSNVIAHLLDAGGFELQVKSVPVARKRRLKRLGAGVARPARPRGGSTPHRRQTI